MHMVQPYMDMEAGALVVDSAWCLYARLTTYYVRLATTQLTPYYLLPTPYALRPAAHYPLPNTNYLTTELLATCYRLRRT